MSTVTGHDDVQDPPTARADLGERAETIADLPAVWQLGTGDDTRRYGPLLIRQQLAAIGPGSGGPWPREDYEHSDAVRWFAGKAQAGDLVVLKEGRSRALAVGVLGDYAFQRDIDLEGWDLCHYRRVRWIATEPRTFTGRPLNVGRFSRVWDERVLRWVREHAQGADLTPPRSEELAPLVDQGPLMDSALLPAAIRTVIDRARAWSDLAWQGEFGCMPSEAEGLCHVTVPLLVALGWPREQIAVEWRNRDVAVFDGLERSPRTCRLVIEGKSLGNGLDHARRQAARYAREFEHPVDVAVTDGPRMRLYRHDAPDAPPLYLCCWALRAEAVDLLNALRHPSTPPI